MYAPTEALRALPAVSSAAIRTRLAYTTARGITVRRYQPSEQQAWDEFVRQGKNTSFMFLRGYMDYHQDRFLDHSLMLYRDRTLLGLLPANRSSDSRVASHDGLTYGGLVLKRDATLLETAELLRAALE
ncbi:MAG: hypothetical protein JNL30_16995, partial [Rubrivivax sp.]|nr:hypothetical protein [Rubrivivax sp.]